MSEKQQGATIAFGTDGGTLKVVSIGEYNEPIPVIDDTHLGVTGKREKCPGSLGDPQEFQVVVQDDGDHAELTKGLVQTITITSALGSFTTAQNWAGTGFVTNIGTPSYSSDTEAIATRTLTIQYDGKTGPTRTLAT